MIEIDPLEAGGKTAVYALDDDTVPTFEQRRGACNRCKETIGDDHNLIVRSHQSGERPGAGNRVKPRACPLCHGLQVDQFGGHFTRNAYDALAFQRQRQRQLEACQTGRSDTQKGAR